MKVGINWNAILHVLNTRDHWIATHFGKGSIHHQNATVHYRMVTVDSYLIIVIMAMEEWLLSENLKEKEKTYTLTIKNEYVQCKPRPLPRPLPHHTYHAC